MAVLCSSASPSMFAAQRTSPSPALSMKSAVPTKFLGTSFGLTEPIAVMNSKRSFQVRCQKDLSVVPLDQRWMFEESEVNGPVTSPSLSPSFPYALVSRGACFSFPCA